MGYAFFGLWLIATIGWIITGLRAQQLAKQLQTLRNQNQQVSQKPSQHRGDL